MADPINIPAANSTLGPAAQGAQKWYYDASTGTAYVNDGWGGTKAVNVSASYSQLAAKIQKDFGIPEGEAMAYAKQEIDNWYSKAVDTKTGQMAPGSPFGGFGSDVFGDPGYENIKKRIQGTIDTKNAEAASAENAQKTSITDRISAFINAMQGAPAPGDATVAQLERSGQSAAGLASGRAGISARSGLAGVQSAASAKAAVMPYLQQRLALADSGLKLLNQRDLGLGQLQQGWTQLEMEKANMQASAQQAQNASLGQMIGGIAGAIPGIALAPYTGGASLSLIGAGSGIGGGFAGSQGGAPNYAGIQKPKAGVNPYTGY